MMRRAIRNRRAMALAASLATLWIAGSATAKGFLPPPVAADFDDDLTTDLLWRRESSGAVNVTLLRTDGSVKATGRWGTPGPDWVIRGTGRFNADMAHDIVWQNTTTAAIRVWFMDGTTRLGGANVGPRTNPAWEIQAVGDVNGDGRSDLVHRRRDNGNVSVWTMEGTTFVSATTYAGPTASTWVIRGVADFDGDRKGDIVWERESALGAAAAWFMDGDQRVGTAILGPAFDPDYEIRGLFDARANLFGDPMVVFERDDNGQVFVWRMNGTGIRATARYRGSRDWTIRATGASGTVYSNDIFWARPDNGRVLIWHMDGVSRTGWTDIGAAAGPGQVLSNQGE